MEKQKRKSTNTKRKEQTRSKTYQLEDYRTKRRQHQTDTASNKNTRRQSQNPYRNYSDTQQQTSDYTSYTNYRDPNYRNTSNQQSPQRTDSPEVRREAMRRNNKETRQEAQRRKKRHKRLVIRRLMTIGCLTAFAVYGTIQLVDMFRYPSISYQTVHIGSIDNAKPREGIVVRDEKVITSPRAGNVHHIVGEGEKVAKGGEVCFVADDDKVAEALRSMTTLDQDIYNMQDKRSDYSYFQSEIHQLNIAIQDDMGSFYHQDYADNPSAIYQLRQQLESVIQDRTSIYIEDTSELTEGLQAERTALQNQLMTYQNTVVAEQSGVVSYAVDGYEALNFETVAQMNYEAYEELVDATESVKVSTIAMGIEQQPLFKLISDGAWKIVTYVSIDESNEYEEGKRYPFYFEEGSGTPTSFTLEKKQEEGKEVKLIFRTDEKIAQFLGTRHTTFTIGENRAEGLKVPLKAIVEKNVMPIPTEYIITQGYYKGVYRQDGDVQTFAPINIQYEDDTHSYVIQEIENTKAIQLGHTIKHPDKDETYTLSEIKPVQGVYVINSSYAKFKSVDVALVNDEHAILKDTADTTVRELDQIISNPQSIRQDQLLKYMNVTNQ